jgi:uncharacterized protein YigA (DUF484 family)
MNDCDVADYLIANPDFFVEHAHLLTTIKLGNPYGKAAVSLPERQIAMLREQNKHLEQRLTELLHYGHENAGITAKFAHWTTRVIATRDPLALPRTITHGLCDVFDVPQVALRVWNVAEIYAQEGFAHAVSEETETFASHLEAPYCGANTGFEATQWFVPATGDEPAGAAIESIALVALRAPEAAAQAGTFGLLAMGSPDAQRFHEGMSTDFLCQIGTLASAALTRLLPD